MSPTITLYLQNNLILNFYLPLLDCTLTFMRVKSTENTTSVTEGFQLTLLCNLKTRKIGIVIINNMKQL